MPIDGNHVFSHEQYVLKEMRARGFAITIFNPGELGKVSAKQLEESMVEHANSVIDQAYGV